ncbi:hypothetical protein LOTGIDRAFT_171212 [Lottia gigantea]|uniref:Uncharacterized protein n=1 Tax=Lottia gigantea TaxID=225164 RepID=V4CMT4_LOTGI|nr:hypothetical protein LOTGIDRAFT_171212 [Lottia gigantea]ESP03680.1 hypothetical protein LOTGIDRAFT_171212 [Lottia gigantea]
MDYTHMVSNEIERAEKFRKIFQNSKNFNSHVVSSASKNNLLLVETSEIETYLSEDNEKHVPSVSSHLDFDGENNVAPVSFIVANDSIQFLEREKFDTEYVQVSKDNGSTQNSTGSEVSSTHKVHPKGYIEHSMDNDNPAEPFLLPTDDAGSLWITKDNNRDTDSVQSSTGYDSRSVPSTKDNEFLTGSVHLTAYDNCLPSSVQPSTDNDCLTGSVPPSAEDDCQTGLPVQPITDNDCQTGMPVQPSTENDYKTGSSQVATDNDCLTGSVPPSAGDDCQTELTVQPITDNDCKTGMPVQSSTENDYQTGSFQLATDNDCLTLPTPDFLIGSLQPTTDNDCLTGFVHPSTDKNCLSGTPFQPTADYGPSKAITPFGSAQSLDRKGDLYKGPRSMTHDNKNPSESPPDISDDDIMYKLVWMSSDLSSFQDAVPVTTPTQKLLRSLRFTSSLESVPEDKCEDVVESCEKRHGRLNKLLTFESKFFDESYTSMELEIVLDSDFGDLSPETPPGSLEAERRTCLTNHEGFVSAVSNRNSLEQNIHKEDNDGHVCVESDDEFVVIEMPENKIPDSDSGIFSDISEVHSDRASTEDPESSINSTLQPTDNGKNEIKKTTKSTRMYRVRNLYIFY